MGAVYGELGKSATDMIVTVPADRHLAISPPPLPLRLIGRGHIVNF